MAEKTNNTTTSDNTENNKADTVLTVDGKNPVKTRNTWNSTEEKQFLLLCRDKSIAEMLDNCLTTARNEEVYSYIRDGLVEKGFKHRDIEKIRQKYRKLKMKFNDIRDHNLHATGQSRKEWVHMQLAEQVWGFRPASASCVLDTDDDDNYVFASILPPLDLTGINDNAEDTPQVANVEKVTEAAPTPKKPKTYSKFVVKFQPGKSKLAKKQTEAKITAESEKYFVDQTVALEEKRMNQQMQLETQRLEAEKSAREANMQFQRDLMQMMLQMRQGPNQLNLQLPQDYYQ